MSKSRRPRRGPSPLVSGGPGEYHPQGGAGLQVLHEGADLQAREFGVPEADVPGGKTHLVNPQAVPETPAPRPERPADSHKYHGVKPLDNGGYDTPPDATEERAPRPAPEPHLSDAVPVFITEGPGSERKIRRLITEGPVTLAAGTTDPVRLADRDPDRVKLWVCNETEGAADSAPVTAQGTFTGAGGGSASLPAGDAITGFIITAAHAAAVEDVTVTVTGAQGGTQTYNYVEPNAGNSYGELAVTYPDPLEPAVAGGVITVAVSVNASGSAGNINVFGASAGAGAPGLRIGDWETASDGRGMLMPAGTMKDFVTQDALYMINESGAPVTVSWGYETMVPAEGLSP